MTVTPEDRLSGELQPGERLLWSGCGDPSVIFARSDVFLIPFSLLWGGFAIFWTAQAAASGAPPFFLVFGGLFCLIGLFFIVGRFFVKAHRKRTTTYAITDRRALSSDGRSTRQTRLPGPDHTVTWSSDRAHVSVVWNQPIAGGFFTGNRTPWPVNSGMDGLFGTPSPLGFYDVPDGAALVSALQAADR